MRKTNLLLCRLWIFFFIILAAVCTFAGQHAGIEKQDLSGHRNLVQKYEVVRVYDGDTVLVKGGSLTFKVRLVGIDAPELGYKGRADQPFSNESRLFLQSMVIRRFVSLTGYGIDRYNRQLAEVFLDGQNVNLRMVQAGFAEVYQGKRAPGFDVDPYMKHESSARQSREGMWIQGSSYTSPRKWRKNGRSSHSPKSDTVFKQFVHWFKRLVRMVLKMD